jgi:paired amphipathic helix protein Sin3a
MDDAFSYLEQVRQQFSDNPEVYKNFLEVMKEFKLHAYVLFDNIIYYHL